MSTNASEAPGNEQIARAPRDEPGRQRINGERIPELILALGNPNHPQHPGALDDLVAIGSPAVGALGAALAPDRPWLTSYRAAEALAQIGDGAASGPLIGALRHPNSNVRWSAVRALAEVGDTRTLWALRRVAHEDRGRTSWGESVAETAQVALDRLQSRSALLRFSEPIKTALVLALTLLALILGVNRVQALRNELQRPVPAPGLVTGPAVATTATTATSVARANASTTANVVATAAVSSTATITNSTTPAVVGRVIQGGRVRSGPSTASPQIGSVFADDQLVFLAQNNGWYKIRLGPEHSSDSAISGTGDGWVSGILVSPPGVPIPTEKAR
ncbi:MAG: HEAT repeat domain-containing protein [Herpetosiphon sp.]